jgi:hypothetical protein
MTSEIEVGSHAKSAASRDVKCLRAADAKGTISSVESTKYGYLPSTYVR